MEVVVLPPQDCLKRPHHHPNPNPNHRRRNNNPNPNPSYSSNHTSRSTRRNRNSNSPPPPTPGPAKAQPVLTGPIRILKRGEDINRTAKPEPEMTRPVERKVRGSTKSESKVDRAVKPAPQFVWPAVGPLINGFYAGSACVTSPPPSELPLPAFFAKSCALSLVSDDVNNKQKIASDLRRVLKLC